MPHQQRNSRCNENKKLQNVGLTTLNSSKNSAHLCKSSNIVSLTDKFKLLTTNSKTLLSTEHKMVKNLVCNKLDPFMSWNTDHIKYNKCQSHLNAGKIFLKIKYKNKRLLNV